ncbi:MAG: TIGR00341 family protein [Lewinellaceae bacterium]|nr:TIGR00341 family protein [Lewinellaceae bacterium]
MRPADNILRVLKRFLLYRFDLTDDKADEQSVVEDMARDAVFKGTNLWTLVFAIFIASVGLNVNSTAVVIGAMLISPLMGPIMAIGFGIGINDFDLIKSAAKNLLIAVGISIITSALYFLLTPLNEAQSELLARTTPTIWDVFIALFGGLAGIVAVTRKEKSNVIPGVAIATALMPPLCTAGYGLGTGQWAYFLGALYLFFINTVFISVSAYLIVRLLKFRKKAFVSQDVEKRVRRNIWFVVAVTVAPSVFMGYRIVQKTLFQQKAQRFVKEEFVFPNTDLLKTNYEYEKDTCRIVMYLMGQPLKNEEIDRMENKLPSYGLYATKLVIRQGNAMQASTDMNSLKAGILEDLYSRNEEALEDRDKRIELLESELSGYREFNRLCTDIAGEIRAEHPQVTGFSINRNIVYDLGKQSSDTIPVVYIKTSKRIPNNEMGRMYNWLKARIKSDTLLIIQ